MFDATTSLGWDTGRAITNAVLLLLAGAPVLAALRRAARRASFGAPVIFLPDQDDAAVMNASSSLGNVGTHRRVEDLADARGFERVETHAYLVARSRST